MTNEPESPASAGEQLVDRMPDGTFPPGKSGNPAGRRKGSRHRASVAMDELLEGEAEKLARKAIDLALDGDGTALRLCLERIAPARRSRPIKLTLPKIETAEDVSVALSAVVSAVADGELDPDEGTALAGIVEIKRRSIETLEIDARLKRLEEATQGKRK